MGQTQPRLNLCAEARRCLVDELPSQGGDADNALSSHSFMLLRSPIILTPLHSKSGWLLSQLCSTLHPCLPTLAGACQPCASVCAWMLADIQLWCLTLVVLLLATHNTICVSPYNNAHVVGPLTHVMPGWGLMP